MACRGRTVPAHRSTIHARPRIFRSTSAAPLALEKCLQSGENHASPTGRPRQTSLGSTSHTLACRCSVYGWFVRCIRIASGSWLMAIATGRPVASSMPVEAPPPPAKLSTMISSRKLSWLPPLFFSKFFMVYLHSIACPHCPQKFCSFPSSLCRYSPLPQRGQAMIFLSPSG